MRALVRAALALSLLTAASPSLANPVDTFGFGSRSTAMAGSNVADVDDFSANYYNPAGLVSGKGLRIELGYVHATHDLQLNGKNNHVDPFRALVFGIVAPGVIAGIPFAFGIGIHLPDDRVLRVRSLEQEQPRWEMYDNRTHRLFFAANLAIRPFSWLEIGGGMAFLAQTRARLDITGEANLDDPKASLLRHEVDADLTSIRYPQVGVKVKATNRLRFGAVYRGEFQLALDIQARLAVEASLLRVPVPLLALISTNSVNAFLPQQIVLGGSYDVTDALTIDADLTWIQWSAYKSPVTRVLSKIIIDAPPGLPSRFLPETPAPTLVLDPKFRDTIVPRIGAEYRFALGPSGADGHELALRAGYFLERSPIREQEGGTNFVDGDRHAFTAGIGLKLAHIVDELPGDLRLDVHGMLSVIPERTMYKSAASDAIGDYKAKGTIWLVGTTLGMVFR
ncbi:MAG: outer membrane protein transport protein [Polyangiales bacterium]